MQIICFVIVGFVVILNILSVFRLYRLNVRFEIMDLELTKKDKEIERIKKERVEIPARHIITQSMKESKLVGEVKAVSDNEKEDVFDQVKDKTVADEQQKIKEQEQVSQQPINTSGVQENKEDKNVSSSGDDNLSEEDKLSKEYTDLLSETVSSGIDAVENTEETSQKEVTISMFDNDRRSANFKVVQKGVKDALESKAKKVVIDFARIASISEKNINQLKVIVKDLEEKKVGLKFTRVSIDLRKTFHKVKLANYIS